MRPFSLVDELIAPCLSSLFFLSLFTFSKSSKSSSSSNGAASASGTPFPANDIRKAEDRERAKLLLLTHGVDDDESVSPVLQKGTNKLKFLFFWRQSEIDDEDDDDNVGDDELDDDERLGKMLAVERKVAANAIFVLLVSFFFPTTSLLVYSFFGGKKISEGDFKEIRFCWISLIQ